MVFADRLQERIAKTGSFLVAGCDPVIDTMPTWLLERVAKKTSSDQEYISVALDLFVDCFLSAVEGLVPAIKPNIAFFEQYGLRGLQVLDALCLRARDKGLQVIADAKRGDIGSTASAYSNAFLGGATVGGKSVPAFFCDALTVNPFLGFDTMSPFVDACLQRGKGLFVLVQTSNPGASAIQGIVAEGVSVSERIATWIAEESEKLVGVSGWSGLGAVVGALYPSEAKRLREIMPKSLFLIPGLGAQGGKASDSVAGFGTHNGVSGGGLINASRGLLAGESTCEESFIRLISENAQRFNSQITQALNP